MNDERMKIERLVKRACSEFGGPAGAHEPDWAPLEAVLPMDECGGFMFMGYATALNREPIRQYKHGITRNYLYLDARCRPYRYVHVADLARPGYYVPFCGTLEHAIDAAFKDIEALGATRSTAYDDAYRERRDAALAAAGYTVVTGNVGER